MNKQDRKNICCTLGYLVAPNDVISDEVYGPAGYFDDVFLCGYIINKIKNQYGFDLLEKLWHGKKDFNTILDQAYSSSSKEVEEKCRKEDILRYIGLD